MYPQHYFLEKSMEEQSRKVERESRTSWWRFGSREESGSGQPKGPAGMTRRAAREEGVPSGVRCPDYEPSRA